MLLVVFDDQEELAPAFGRLDAPVEFGGLLGRQPLLGRRERELAIRDRTHRSREGAAGPGESDGEKQSEGAVHGVLRWAVGPKTRSEYSGGPRRKRPEWPV